MLASAVPSFFLVQNTQPPATFNTKCYRLHFNLWAHSKLDFNSRLMSVKNTNGTGNISERSQFSLCNNFVRVLLNTSLNVA